MSSSSSKILPPFRPLDGKSYFVKMNDFVLSPVVVFVFWLSFLIIAFATNEKKGTNVEEKFAANEKKGNKSRKSTGKQTNKCIKNPTIYHNLTTTDGPSREREKGRERESEGNTNATTRRIVLISVSFPSARRRRCLACPRVHSN